MRLAVVNWRDPWHPAAGGAERYAWEIARRLAARGDRVRYVTARAPGQARRDRVDGVEFVRLGGRFTVYPLVLLWMLVRRRAFDTVIDCQNGIPFFTPWVLPRRTRVFCVVHHVHDAQFGLYFPGWLAWLGRWLEGPASRRAYRRHAFVVVSESTRRAVRERLGWRGPTHVIHNGSSPPGCPAELPAGLDAPRGTPDLVCVTRLVPHKQLDHLLDLAERLRRSRPDLRLHVVGDGPEAPRLAAEIERRALTGTVIAHGFVPEATRAALVARADLHLSTSQGEGWGLSVIEAAALGVPTAAYDVDGLRDAVRPTHTGWLAPTPASLPTPASSPAPAPQPDPVGRPGPQGLVEVVEGALGELDDPDRRREIAAACREWAGVFDWSATAARWGDLIRRYGDGQPPAARPEHAAR